MAEIPSLQLPGLPELAGTPVTVKGNLTESQWGSAYWPTAWRGIAVAREPLLALVFATDGEGVRWMKSMPSWGNAVAVEVVHGPWSKGHQANVSLTSLVWPPVREARSWEEAASRAHGIFPPDGEIQVPDQGAASVLCASGHGIDEPASWPPRQTHGTTGRLLPLLHLPGASPLRIDLLMLPRHALRVGRCKIWHLKRRYRDAIPEPLRHVLCFGRRGRWPPIRWPNQRYG